MGAYTTSTNQLRAPLGRGMKQSTPFTKSHMLNLIICMYKAVASVVQKQPRNLLTRWDVYSNHGKRDFSH